MILTIGVKKKAFGKIQHLFIKKGKTTSQLDIEADLINLKKNIYKTNPKPYS